MKCHSANAQSATPERDGATAYGHSRALVRFDLINYYAYDAYA